MVNIFMENIQDIAFEVQHSSDTVEEASSFIGDLFQAFSALLKTFLVIISYFFNPL